MPESLIDLRSDTLTRPDAAMRRAMAEAEVGDDVLGEDPTVVRLEAAAAEAVGQEAALFVPSGTMGNQIALHLHGRPGSEVILDARSHILFYEMGAMAAISGLLPRPLPTSGLLAPEAVAAAISPGGPLASRTAAIAVENTALLAGGRVYPLERLDALVAVARRAGLPIHLDGARMWNAAVALGVPPARLGSGFDSVMFCLSKGLGAPVGSLLCAPRELIREARRVRKMLGGGMRQVGVLAAAGRVALEAGPARLADDHAHAALLAAAVAELPGVDLELPAVETNIVLFRLRRAEGTAEPPAEAFLARARLAGVLGSALGPDLARFVTYRDIGRAEAEEAARRLRRLAQGLRKGR